MPARAPLLRIYNLSYRRTHAVLHRLSFVLPAGVTAFLPVQAAHPSACPVSTLLGILACDSSPAEGTIALNGPLRYGSKDYRRAVAWLPPKPEIFLGLNAREHVAYCAWLKGVPKKLAWDRSIAALTRLGLDGIAGDPVTELSALTQRLLEVARAMCHRARIVMIDAPELAHTERSTLLRTVSEHREEYFEGVFFHATGTTEASDVADNLVLVAENEIPFAGTLTEFRAAVAADAGLLRRAQQAPTDEATR